MLVSIFQAESEYMWNSGLSQTHNFVKSDKNQYFPCFRPDGSRNRVIRFGRRYFHGYNEMVTEIAT